jgi:hypothetical protein
MEGNWMKKILVLLAVFTLMIASSIAAGGAIHNTWNDLSNYAGQGNGFAFPNPGGWYYSEKLAPKELPYFIATGALLSEDFYTSNSMLGTVLYINDFTFAEFSNAQSKYVDERIFVKGSYLFKNNVFAGLDYCSVDDSAGDSITVLSVGYRFEIGEGFLALSTDYVSASFDSAFEYDLDFRYYTENARMYGQLYNVAGNWSTYNEGTYADFGLAYRFSKKLVAGIDLGSWEGYGYIRAGFTYYTAFMTLDIAADDNEDAGNNTFYLMDMFKVNDNLKLGFSYFNPSDLEGIITVKGIYYFNEKMLLGAEYRLKNDSLPSQFAISFYKGLF